MSLLYVGILIGIGITIAVEVCIIELLSDAPVVDPRIDFDHIDMEELNHEFRSDAADDKRE